MTLSFFSKNQTPDRRNNVRMSCEPMLYAHGVSTVPAAKQGTADMVLSVKNISGGGVQVLSKVKFVPGQIIKIKLFAQDTLTSIEFFMTVIRCSEMGQSSHYLTAGKYYQISRDLKKKIIIFIAKHLLRPDDLQYLDIS